MVKQQFFAAYPGMSGFFNYRISLAGNQDREAIKELVFSVLLEYGLVSGGPTDVDLEDIETHYFDTGGFFALIKDPSEKVIGTFGLYLKSPGRAEIRKMYLHEAHRGRGLGKMMMNYIFQFAQLNGIKRLELETNAVLEKALHLYRKIGFKPLHEHELSPRCDQAYYLDLH